MQAIVVMTTNKTRRLIYSSVATSSSIKCDTLIRFYRREKNCWQEENFKQSKELWEAEAVEGLLLVPGADTGILNDFFSFLHLILKDIYLQM